MKQYKDYLLLFVFFLLILRVLGQDSFEDFDLYSYPTQLEFEVYKYTWALLWDAPPDQVSEHRVIQKVSRKYDTTAEQVDKILLKLEYYNNLRGGQGKPIEDMTWETFKAIMKWYGTPWPQDNQTTD